MKARALIVVAASAVLLSCALLSGASDLTTGDLPDGGASPSDGDGATNDALVTQNDASSDAKLAPDGARIANCDEPGLVARWTFDEGSGNAIHDCTSGHNDGINDGGLWTNGARDGGLSFDAGWVGFGTPADVELTTTLSVCAWIRPEGLPPANLGRGYVVAKLSDPNTAGWRIAIARVSQGPVATVEATLNVPVPDSGANEAAGGSMALDVWSHICGVFSAAGSFVYVNGNKAGSDATPAMRITTTNDELRVGARSDGASPFVGVIDDVRIYSRALTDTEIKALAQP